MEGGGCNILPNWQLAIKMRCEENQAGVPEEGRTDPRPRPSEQQKQTNKINPYQSSLETRHLKVSTQ